MAISPPKTPELSSKLSYFKVTIKSLGSKLEELRKRNEELKKENIEEGGSKSERSRDFAEQMKMIEKIIEEQKEKEAIKQAKVEQEKQREEYFKEKKQNEGNEVFEILLREDELKKMQKFCNENKINIFVSKEFSPAEEKIAEILHGGPKCTHPHSSDQRQL
jgi:hypothetical protein